MGCKKIGLGDFRDQKVDLDAWILFYHQAQTHSLMEKKTRSSNSNFKILCARPTFLVHVQNWEKIIAKTFQTLRKDISALRGSWELRFWQDLCSWTHFRFFWKSDVDFSHFDLFLLRFSITSFSELRRNWASCLDVHGDLCLHFGLFSRNLMWNSCILIFFVVLTGSGSTLLNS